MWFPGLWGENFHSGEGQGSKTILLSEDLKDVRVVISAIPPPTHQCVSQETGGSLAAANSANKQLIAAAVPIVGSLPGMSLGFQEHGIQPPSRKCLISIPNKK